MQQEGIALVFGVERGLLFALALHSLEKFLLGEVLLAEFWGFDLWAQ